MKNKLISFFTATAMLMALAGCGNTNQSAGNAAGTTDTTDTGNLEIAETTETQGSLSQAAETDAAVTFPITIPHAYGETVIEEQPVNVVSLGWGNQDAVLALGITPVGTSMANFGAVGESGLLPWTEEAYEALGVTDPVVFDDTDGFDFEAISDANPDIIVAAYSGMTQEEYDTLSQIAPVVPYTEMAWATTWRDQTMEIAAALGMEAEGQEIVVDAETDIAAAKEAYPSLDGKTAALFWVDATNMSSFYVYTTTDPRGAYLEDLGFAFPEGVAALDDGSSFTVTISSENIDVINDVDIIIAYGDEATLAAMQADPLFSQVPAVEKGNVVLLDSTSELAAACSPSILSIPTMAEKYMALIDENYEE